MMKKRIAACILGIAAAFAFSITSFAGTWVQDENGTAYLDDNGEPVRDQWIEEDGKWYYFKPSGYMARDIYIKKAYVGTDGVRADHAVPSEGTYSTSETYDAQLHYWYDYTESVTISYADEEKIIIDGQTFVYNGDNSYTMDIEASNRTIHVYITPSSSKQYTFYYYSTSSLLYNRTYRLES